jgi:aryl-alcohol dehydrogenase-like predicted oxidoreductase
MQTVTLGATRLEVTPVAYGTWQIGGDWVLAHPAVQVAIVGARTPVHLDESAGALDLTLSQADLAEIDHIMAAAVPVGGPTPEGMS